MDQLVFFYHLRCQIPLAAATTVRQAVGSPASSAGLIRVRLIVAGNGWVLLNLGRVVTIVVAKEVITSTVGDVVNSVIQV